MEQEYRGPGILSSLGDPLVRSLSSATRCVALCSPYLGFVPADEISTIAQRGSATWELLTVLDPVAAAGGALSLDGLRRMIAAGITVRSLPGLHAKVFLVDDAIGFVGSANLTSPGLGMGDRRNLEVTAVLSAAQLAEASVLLAQWRDQAEVVTDAMIDACQADAARLPVRISRTMITAGASSTDVELANALLDEGLQCKVWIKAMYTYRFENWVNSSKKGRPSFNVGDLLVIYVGGTNCCYAVVSVAGETRNDPAFLIANGRSAEEAERWPWVTPVDVRLRLPETHGAPIAEVGKSGQSVQGGHCEMPVGGLPVMLKTMLELRRRAG
jgi:hypothetical protein